MIELKRREEKEEESERAHTRECRRKLGKRLFEKLSAGPSPSCIKDQLSLLIDER